MKETIAMAINKDKDKGGTGNKNLYEDVEFHLFNDAQEAWFWFVQAQEARNEGARFTAGVSLFPRPCEPADMLKILDGLYRQRRLMRDHLLVLRHYGRRQLAPDLNRVKEVQAHRLWHEALERIEPILIRKGIVQPKKFLNKLGTNHPNKFWSRGAVVHSNKNFVRASL